jgi:hypothetical protein
MTNINLSDHGLIYHYNIEGTFNRQLMMKTLPPDASALLSKYFQFGIKNEFADKKH